MSKRFKKLSHTLYECKYHIVFCPKYRYKILTGDVLDYVRQEIYVLCRHRDLIEVLELNVQPDHVHLLVSVPPKYSISSFVGYLKGKLSLRLFQRFERLSKQYWGRHLWSRGYCVSSVGLDEAMIKNYVRWQEKKERDIEQKQMKLF